MLPPPPPTTKKNLNKRSNLCRITHLKVKPHLVWLNILFCLAVFGQIFLSVEKFCQSWGQKMREPSRFKGNLKNVKNKLVQKM